MPFVTLFFPLNGVKVKEIHIFLLQHTNSFLILGQIVFSAYYNQVRNANAELQLLSLILNVSIISVIYIPSAWMLPEILLRTRNPQEACEWRRMRWSRERIKRLWPMSCCWEAAEFAELFLALQGWPLLLLKFKLNFIQRVLDSWLC